MVVRLVVFGYYSTLFYCGSKVNEIHLLVVTGAREMSLDKGCEVSG